MLKYGDERDVECKFFDGPVRYSVLTRSPLYGPASISQSVRHANHRKLSHLFQSTFDHSLLSLLASESGFFCSRPLGHSSISSIYEFDTDRLLVEMPLSVSLISAILIAVENRLQSNFFFQ